MCRLASWRPRRTYQSLLHLLPENTTRPSIKFAQTHLYHQASKSSAVTQYSKGNIHITNRQTAIVSLPHLQGKGQTQPMEKQQAGSTSSNPEEDAEYSEPVVTEVMEDGDGDNEVEQEQEEEEDEEAESISLEVLPVQFQKVGRFGYCHCWCCF